MTAGVFLSVPFFVSAQYTPVTDQFTGAQTTCLDLQYNMSYRSRDARSNGEVSDLQDFLNTNGYLSVEPTGYFGVATIAAVKKFQSAILGATSSTPGYGGIGPKSRAKIKAMTCGGNSISTTTATIISTQSTTSVPIIPAVVGVAPSISILSPSNGERIEAGTDYMVRWSTSNFPANTPVTITLLDEAGIFTKNNVAVDTTNDGYESWRVPATLPNSNYRIRVFCTQRGCVMANNQSVVEGKSGSFTIVATSTTGATTTIPAVTSFTVEDSTVWPGYKRFVWATSNASSVDFIVDCAPGLNVSTMMLTSPFRCGVMQSGITPLEMFLKFTNTTTVPINITAAVRAVGSAGYNPASKVVSMVILAAPTPIISSVATNQDSASTTAAVPTVSGISPSQFKSGDINPVTIYGSNFVSPTASGVTASGVEFLQGGQVVSNGDATYISPDGTQLKFRIRGGFNTGGYQLRVINFDVKSSSFVHSNSVDFSVIQ